MNWKREKCLKEMRPKSDVCWRGRVATTYLAGKVVEAIGGGSFKAEIFDTKKGRVVVC